MPEMLPTEQEAALALITANGNTNLAAERLGIKAPQLLLLLSNADLTRLNMQLKTALAIRSFTLLNMLQDSLEMSISDMEPKDMGKTYLGLLNALPNLLPSPQAAAKPITTEDILAALPPDIRDAYETALNGSNT